MKFSNHTAHETAKPHGFIAYWPLFIVSSLFLLLSCARIGTPDGGPYDETPPRVVRTSPKYGTANAKGVKKVTIEFDEIIKVDNAMEKVVISPPQIEQPEIEAIGKKVTITLLDSLKPNMTYTIDFADAIVDNNEGNPYGDYAFTFSTGEQVDSFQVSGHVLEASDLEPIKGMLVGLYKLESSNNEVDTLPDSIFTQSLLSASRAQTAADTLSSKDCLPAITACLPSTTRTRTTSTTSEQKRWHFPSESYPPPASRTCALTPSGTTVSTTTLSS